MSDQFDPYYKWLGIPPEEQPPNHYRLLGVPLFIDDMDVIENAADQRMGHLRTFQSGKHSRDSQRLLNELSNARVSLLNPESKLAYDGQLRSALAASETSDIHAHEPFPDLAQLESGIGQLGSGVGRATAPQKTPFNSQSFAPSEKPASAPSKPKPKWLVPAMLGGGSVIALIVIVAVVLMNRGGDGKVVIKPNDNLPPVKPKVDPPASPRENPTTPVAPIPAAPTDVPNDPANNTNTNSPTLPNQNPGTSGTGQAANQPSSPYALRLDPRTYVELTNSKGLISRDKPFTVEFWLRCKTAVLMNIVGDRAKRGQHPDVVQVDDVGWILAFFQKDGVQPLVALQNGGNQFLEGDRFRWFHVAMSTDGADLILYENGKRKTRRTDTWMKSVTNIFIGDGPYSRRPELLGSATYFEIAALRISSVHRYAGDFTPPRSYTSDDATVVLLDFSNPTNDSIADLSGHNHHGTIHDAKWIKLDNATPSVPKNPL